MKSLLVKSLLVISVVTLTSWLAFAAPDDWDPNVDNSNGSDSNLAMVAQGAGVASVGAPTSTGSGCAECDAARALSNSVRLGSNTVARSNSSSNSNGSSSDANSGAGQQGEK